MKQAVVPGASIDALTPQEAESIIADALGRQGRPEEAFQADAHGTTNAAGVCPQFEVYVCPVGQMAIVTRLYLAADGATFLFPFSSSNVNQFFGAEVQRNGATVDGFALNGAATLPTMLPWTINQGKSQGIVLRNGDRLSVGFGGNTSPGNNIGVVCRVQGWLLPLEEIPVGDRYKPRGGRG